MRSIKQTNPLRNGINKEKEKGNTVSEPFEYFNNKYFWMALGRGRVIWDGVDPSSVPLTKTIIE